MGFKRVQEVDINEVVLAAYIPKVEKSKEFVIDSKYITNILPQHLPLHASMPNISMRRCTKRPSNGSSI